MEKVQCLESALSLLEAILMKQSFGDSACLSRKQSTWLDVYHSDREEQFDRVKSILVNIYGKDAYRTKIGRKTLQRLCCTIKQIERRSAVKRNNFLDRASSCVLALASIVTKRCGRDESIAIQEHEVGVLLRVCTNNVEKLEELLSLGNSFESTAAYRKGMTPIHFAVLWDNIEALNVLLKYSKNTKLINQKDLYGYTCLHYAVQSSSMTSARLLLQNDADANAKLQDGKTPLHMAAYHVIPELVILLCQHGADVSAVNLSGETPLIMAVRSRDKSRERLGLQLTVISLLLRYGSCPNVHDSNGRTPMFHVWYNCKDERCAVMLCAAGADIIFPRQKLKNRSAVTGISSVRRFLGMLNGTPLRLDISCLVTVRKTMGKSFPHRVKDLPLSDRVKKMLLFQALPKLV